MQLKKLHPNQELEDGKKCEKCSRRHGCTYVVVKKNSQYSSGHGSLRPRQFFDELYWPSYYSLLLLYSNVKMKNGMAREMTQGPD